MPHNDEIQFSNDYDAIVEWLDALPLLGLFIHAPVHVLNYLLTQVALCIKPSVSPKRLKIELKLLYNGLYKIGHGLPTADKMYDLELPLSKI